MKQTFKELKELFSYFADDLSRRVFWARLRADLDPSAENILELVSLSGGLAGRERETWKKDVERFARLARPSAGEKVVLYGTGEVGQSMARSFDKLGVAFYGFSGRRAAAFPHGLMGRPVLSPEELTANPELYYVVIATSDKYYEEIADYLKERRFPRDRILLYIPPEMRSQYFDFPDLYPKNTAFVDGGCFDLGDSIRFSTWCGGQYTRIFAFEPDPACYATCVENAKREGLERVELIQSGLAAEVGTASFFAEGHGSSRIVQSESGNQIQTIQTVSIDATVGDTTIGFVKLDVEGAELSVLRGAETVIQRDRPFLAVCVYHRPGDLLDITSYLHSLVPEYRFYLRHYSVWSTETVLYATASRKNYADNGGTG